MAERIIGVDFGTSTSVMRVKRYEDGKPAGERLEVKEVMFDGENMVPTLIQKKEDDPSVVYFGNKAKQQKKKHTVYCNFKMYLESEDAQKREAARRLIEEFYRYMAKTYKSQKSLFGESTDEERTIVSYPVKWSRETKEFMVNAAKRAGFPNVSGVDEARAAIWGAMVQNSAYLKEKGLLADGMQVNILLVDMGAVTTDLVLCRYTPGAGHSVEVLTTWPPSGEILFGGQEVDLLLQEFFRKYLSKEDARLVLGKVGTKAFKSWKEQTVSPALMKNEKVCEFWKLDEVTELLAVEMDEYCLDRSAFEECLSGYLKQFPTLVNGCIQASPIDGGDVDLVVVTGGHSQWYFVREMLAGNMAKFGEINLPKIKNCTDPKTGKEEPDRIITIARLQETVARGLVYSPMGAEVVSQPKAGVISQPKAEPKSVGMTSGRDDDLYLGMDLTKLSREDVMRYYRKYFNQLMYEKDEKIVIRCADGRMIECDKAGAAKVRLEEGQSNIVAIAAGNKCTVGLKKDGTVTAVSNYGQIDVTEWRDIVAVAVAGDMLGVQDFIVGLKRDGTVTMAGNNGSMAITGNNGSMAITGWRDIVSIVASSGMLRFPLSISIVGLKKDGTVTAVSNNEPMAITGWRDIVSIAVEDSIMTLWGNIVGLKKDGTVVATRANGTGWRNIVSIAAGSRHTVGLKKDGTVVAMGHNEYGQTNVSLWRDVVAIGADGHYTVGITKNGEILYNTYRKEKESYSTGFLGLKTETRTNIVPTGTKVIDAHVFDTH